MSPVKIAPAGHRFAKGDAVFSRGCDHGNEPSLRDSRVTSIDRYLGPPNIETTGEPAQGRSGGGLFSQDGFLIGICNHGDPRDDEGIYASLPTIHWELDRVGQRRLYQPNAEEFAVQGLARRQSEPQPADTGQQLPAQTVSPVATVNATFNHLANADTEVICIVRSRGNPQAQERVYVFEQPSSDFLDRLARESRGTMSASQIATRSEQPATPQR